MFETNMIPKILIQKKNKKQITYINLKGNPENKLMTTVLKYTNPPY